MIGQYIFIVTSPMGHKLTIEIASGKGTPDNPNGSLVTVGQLREEIALHIKGFTRIALSLNGIELKNDSEFVGQRVNCATAITCIPTNQQLVREEKQEEKVCRGENIAYSCPSVFPNLENMKIYELFNLLRDARLYGAHVDVNPAYKKLEWLSNRVDEINGNVRTAYNNVYRLYDWNDLEDAHSILVAAINSKFASNLSTQSTPNDFIANMINYSYPELTDYQKISLGILRIIKAYKPCIFTLDDEEIPRCYEHMQLGGGRISYEVFIENLNSLISPMVKNARNSTNESSSNTSAQALITFPASAPTFPAMKLTQAIRDFSSPRNGLSLILKGETSVDIDGVAHLIVSVPKNDIPLMITALKGTSFYKNEILGNYKVNFKPSMLSLVAASTIYRKFVDLKITFTPKPILQLEKIPMNASNLSNSI